MHYSGKLVQVCCIFFLIIDTGKIRCLKRVILFLISGFSNIRQFHLEKLSLHNTPFPFKAHITKKKKNSVITSFSPPVFKDPIQLLPRLQKLCLTPAVPTYPTPSLPQSMFPQSHRHSHQHTPTKLTSFSAFCFLLPQYHVHFLLYFTLFFLSLIFLNFFIFELKDKSFTEVRAGTQELSFE